MCPQETHSEKENERKKEKEKEEKETEEKERTNPPTKNEKKRPPLSKEWRLYKPNTTPEKNIKSWLKKAIDWKLE